MELKAKATDSTFGTIGVMEPSAMSLSCRENSSGSHGHVPRAISSTVHLTTASHECASLLHDYLHN